MTHHMKLVEDDPGLRRVAVARVLGQPVQVLYPHAVTPGATDPPAFKLKIDPPAGHRQIADPQNVSAAHRMERIEVSRIDECWSMDFVADNLFNGRRIRALTVVDNFSRECLAITVNHHLRGDEVVRTMEHIKALRGVPERIQVDNGSEFISKALDLWAYENQVILDFSRPGKPTDNPFIESFNGSFRDECLNLNWFLSLDDAQEKIEAWRIDYNEFRPHQSLGDMTPMQFVAEYQEAGFL